MRITSDETEIIDLILIFIKCYGIFWVGNASFLPECFG